MVQIEDNVFEDIIRSLCQNNKVFACKVVAKCYECSLKDSKEYVESLLKEEQQRQKINNSNYII